MHVDLLCFSLTLSLFTDKFWFWILSVRLREAAELRHYSLVGLSGFCKCMFWYNSPGHKCDNSLLFERVVDNLLICMDHCLFLSRLVSLLIGKLRERLLNCSIYQAFLHMDNDMASNSSETSIQKLWFSQLCCCCSSHCINLHVINENQNILMINKTYKETQTASVS